MAYTKDNQKAEVIAANETEIVTVSKLLQGRMPETENEIAAEKWALLNLGVNPVIGSTFTLDTKLVTNDYKSEIITYKVTGIINDLTFNKRAGAAVIYTGLNQQEGSDYIATIKFKENTNKTNAIKEIQKDLNIPKKSISQNVWEEDMQELVQKDVGLGILLILVCSVIIFGVYRISLMARENQYGILRAIGMKRK